MVRKHFLSASLAALAMMAGASGAQAAVYSFTGSGTGVDGPVSASANLTTSLNSISVALTSLLANPTAAGQEVSGIVIDLASAATGVTLGSQTGTLINIAPGGAVTAVGGNPTHWGAGETGNQLFLETAGNFAVGGSPINLIIGPGPYTNANPSITGRNPQIQGTGNFVLNLTGAGTPTVTGVRFLFGTGPDSSLVGVCTAGCGGIPEPATWAVMIVGFFAVGSVLRVSRRRKALAAA
jgi:hypothetical protein